MKVVFGGTFDPVHLGHLKIAAELKEFLGVKFVYLMPCFKAVHKSFVGASAEHRLEMLKLSVQGNAALEVDDRELCRGKPSFTINSMREMRAELGDAPLCFVVGLDAANGITGWREAESFSKLSHIIVLNRPGGASLDQTELLNLGFKKAESVADLKQASGGSYLFISLAEINISSTMIRKRVNEKACITSFVTDAVDRYICDNRLYH